MATASLLELDQRIAIVRDNIRELTEQAAALSGAEDETRIARGHETSALPLLGWALPSPIRVLAGARLSWRRLA